jgi:hypothetical protein
MTRDLTARFAALAALAAAGAALFLACGEGTAGLRVLALERRVEQAETTAAAAYSVMARAADIKMDNPIDVRWVQLAPEDADELPEPVRRMRHGEAQ